jgi:hypothetical protein
MQESGIPPCIILVIYVLPAFHYLAGKFHHKYESEVALQCNHLGPKTIIHYSIYSYHWHGTSSRIFFSIILFQFIMISLLLNYYFVLPKHLCSRGLSPWSVYNKLLSLPVGELKSETERQKNLYNISAVNNTKGDHWKR